MLRRLLTIGLFLTGGLEVTLAARHSKLPMECRDLSLAEGDPVSSKTIIFGDTHNKPECHSSYLRCAKALTEGLTPEDIVLLVERAPMGKHVLCEEDERADWGSLAGSCQGLNEAEEVMKSKIAIAEKFQVNFAVLDVITEASGLIKSGKIIKTNELQEFLNEKLIHHKKLISESQQNHNRLFKKFTKKHPTVKKSEFHSDELVDQQRNELVIQKLEGIQNELKAGKTLKDIIIRLDGEMDGEEITALAMKDNPSTFLGNPNTYFTQSIHQQSKQKKKVIGIIGDKHINKKRSEDAEERAVVEDFYRGLKEHEHENPWSVLSCN